VNICGPALLLISNSREGLRMIAGALSFLFLSFLVVGVTTLAQQSQPTSYAGFEGQKVSSVEIAVRPEISTEPLEKLITQKAGEPFSTAAIQESVAALQKTKSFTQIQLSITPEQEGLRVLFILQPAYYVGLLSFPGTKNRFPYTQLLQAVNIPDQIPFTKDLLPQGQKELVHFFQTKGYFKATVQPHSEADDAHRIVNLIFDVDLNEKARIGTLDFEGISASQADEIRAALRSRWARLKRDSLEPGQRYSDSRISRSVDYIRAHFRGQGRLAPNVRVASTSFHAETNLADLSFQIDPGPSFSVSVEGARVSKGTVKRLVPIYEENSIDQDLVDEGERNLVSYFQSKGYFDVKIQSQLDRESNRVSVVYDVTRGSRRKLAAIHFQGNHYFTDEKLAPYVLIKKARFLSRGKFSNDLLRKSTDALTGLYQNQGFADVKVETRLDESHPETSVTFVISEGVQDRVNTIRVIGNETQALSALLGSQPLHVQAGKFYSPQAVQLDRNKILAAYLDKGYPNPTFQLSVSKENGDPHLINVIYRITEGPRTSIRNVALLGATRTHAGFVNHIVGPNVASGKPLSTGKLLQAESDLYNLNIFDWVNIQSLEPITTQTDTEVLEEVHEESRNTINYGGGIEVIPRTGNVPVGAVALPGLPPIGLGSKFEASQKSFFGPRGEFDYTRRNIFGRGQTFTASTVLSRLDQRLDFTFSDPHFRNSSWSSSISISGEYTTENPIYAAEVAIASYQMKRPLNAKRTQDLILRYEYNRTILSNLEIPDLVPPQDQHVRLSTFSAQYSRDTRDKPLDARKGVYQIFDFGVTSVPLGSDANFVRFLGQAAFYLPVRPWLTWANNFRLGLAIPFAGSFVPLSEAFFSGGAESLRGFPINGAGPQRPVQVCTNPADPSTCSLISVPVGGESLFIFNTEARFPIPNHWTNKVGGAIFYDGGNVYAHVNLPQMWKQYTNTIGFGLRYNTPVGPIRFDIGHRLTSIPGVNATQYFVTLGQAF
jgi:outer membrane protein insertion porin family